MGFVVVALLHPGTHECMYSVLRGLPFGLGSAVNQFNRAPFLLTAAARRLLYVMGGHCVDDNVIVDSALFKGDAQQAFQELARLLGVALSDGRSLAIAHDPLPPAVVYTDASADTGRPPRLGAPVFVLGRTPACPVYDVSDNMSAHFGSQGGHVINQAELLAAPLLAWSMPSVLQNRDVLWFIDNQAAESAFVK
ncbi:unnamed protein product, partial [Prorocentrum cordatum]